MAKMLQVRNIPDRLHRELVRRAKKRGQSLTEYVQDVLEREISRPPAPEVFERISAREPVELPSSAAGLVRAERASREAS